MKNRKKAQQEMVGFVLIVVLVIIGGLILFLINIKKESAETPSEDLYNFLSSSLTYTTDCAPVIVPQYSSLADLVSGCFTGETCENIKKDSCSYLNETLNRILQDFIKTRNDISGYRLDIFYNSSTGNKDVISPFEYGDCSTSKVLKAEEKVNSRNTDITLRFRTCIV
jgi:hypothetical protein